MKQNGYRPFFIIWLGQLVSRMGTAVTRFAIIIWAYNQTDSATAVALLGFCAFIPMIAISPFAGVWIDRLDRRKIMLFADISAGATTLALLLLFASGQLQMWHLYIIQALSGIFEAFQRSSLHHIDQPTAAKRAIYTGQWSTFDCRRWWQSHCPIPCWIFAGENKSDHHFAR